MDDDQAAELARLWFAELVDTYAGGSPTKFAKLTGIKQSDVSNVVNKKKRKVTWRMIARLAQSEKHLAPIGALLANLARRFANEAVEEALRTAPESKIKTVQRWQQKRRKSTP